MPSKAKFWKDSALQHTVFHWFQLLWDVWRIADKWNIHQVKKGKRPTHFRQISEELISKHQLLFRKEPYYNRTIYRYYLTVIPDLKFSPRELEIINHSIDKLSNENATTITKYAKRDPPISVAEFGEAIDFRYVFSRGDEYSLINK